MNGEWIQVASNTVVHPDTQAAYEQQPSPVSDGQKKGLLAVREAVWRAYFTNDRPSLEQVIPGEVLAIDASETGQMGECRMASRFGQVILRLDRRQPTALG